VLDLIRLHLGAATAIDVHAVDRIAAADGDTHAPVVSRLPIGSILPRASTGADAAPASQSRAHDGSAAHQ
jgi:hypothetical protein